MIRLIKDFIKWRKQQKQFRAVSLKDTHYLLNCFADAAMLQDAINKCNAEPDVVVEFRTLEGVRLTIKTARPTNKENRWNTESLIVEG